MIRVAVRPVAFARTVAPRGTARIRRVVGAALPPLAVAGVVLAIWLFVSYGLLSPERRFLLPPPQDVIAVGLLDPTNFADISGALGLTAQVAFVGLLVAAILGIGIAIAMSQARAVERSLYPWAVFLQTIPILAIVPLIGFWFSFGFFSRVIVCVMIALFPIITNTLFGLKSADPAHHDLFTLHRASRRERLLKLQLPGALPAIFAGLRISAGLSVVGAIVGDFFFRQGDPGIGRLMDIYTGHLQSEPLFAAIALSSLLGLGVFWTFGFLGHLATRSWRE